MREGSYHGNCINLILSIDSRLETMPIIRLFRTDDIPNRADLFANELQKSSLVSLHN